LFNSILSLLITGFGTPAAVYSGRSLQADLPRICRSPSPCLTVLRQVQDNQEAASSWFLLVNHFIALLQTRHAIDLDLPFTFFAPVALSPFSFDL
jgi:hypothetical protein